MPLRPVTFASAGIERPRAPQSDPPQILRGAPIMSGGRAATKVVSVRHREGRAATSLGARRRLA
jgi:hypothetical protein